MGWVTRGLPGSEQLLSYERRLQHEVFPTGIVTGMCEFDRRRFEDSVLHELHSHHPDGIVHAERLFQDECLQILPMFESFGARLFGEIDIASVDTFESALHQLAYSTNGDVHLDVGAVRFMGPKALSALARFARGLTDERVVVVLNMSQKSRRVMETVGGGESLRMVFENRPGTKPSSEIGQQ